MKSKYMLAVLLTVVFLVSVFTLAQADSPFRIDQRRVLSGMKRSWLQGYEPTISQNVMTFVLPVLSDSASGSIDAEIILDDETLSPFKLQNMKIKTQRFDGDVWPVRFSLNLHEDRCNGDYAATIRIAGRDKQGNALQAEIPYTFRIRDGQPSSEVIRLQVEKVEAAFKVGEDSAITVTLHNPTQTVPFEQPVLEIADAVGEIIPEKSGVLYLDDLAPGESVTVEFPMTVLPGASVSPHIIRMDMSWKALGHTAVQSESYTLPVTQEIKMEHGGLRMSASVIAGDAVSVTLPVMNRGRANIIDVMAILELPGVVDRQSVLVGTIAPGETKTAQLSVTPNKNVEGDFTGKLNVIATDNDGNPAEFSLPVSLAVEKTEEYDLSGMQSTQAGETPILVYALAGGCGLLLIICIVQGAVLRRKIRKLEEERL